MFLYVNNYIINNQIKIVKKLIYLIFYCKTQNLINEYSVYLKIH